jgi:hypothetical protein
LKTTKPWRDRTIGAACVQTSDIGKNQDRIARHIGMADKPIL